MYSVSEKLLIDNAIKKQSKWWTNIIVLRLAPENDETENKVSAKMGIYVNVTHLHANVTWYFWGRVKTPKHQCVFHFAVVV